MAWKLFKKKKQNGFFLCLDIGTEAVKSVIFFVGESKKIIVLGAGLEYFNRVNIFDTRDFEKDVLKLTISKAVEKAKQNLSFSLADKKLKKQAGKQKKWN